MFKVLKKNTDKEYTVYAVRVDEVGETQFLFGDKSSYFYTWSWDDAKDYEPLE